MNPDWRLYALGSALIAALTTIFGKVAISEINSHLATFFRTVIILIVAALILSALAALPEHVPSRGRRIRGAGQRQSHA
jgi:uncharacterized membrane protein